MNVDLSVIIPFYNEAQCIEKVCQETLAVLRQDLSTPYVWELILVNDGSTDDTALLIDNYAQLNPKQVRSIHLDKNSGQSAALEAGFLASRGKLIATLDGDGQNDPHDIPLLINAIYGTKVDMMCGIRTQRADNLLRRLSSRIANKVRNAILHDHITDVGCSLRVFHRHCLPQLCFFRNAHRFFPALIQMRDFTVAEMPVRHRTRLSGLSKYGSGIQSRLWAGLLDLMGVWWLRKRSLHYKSNNPVWLRADQSCKK